MGDESRDDARSPTRRPIGATILAVLYALACGSALRETFDELLSSNSEGVVLALLQGLTAASACGAAIGIWRRTRWATNAVIIYGVVAASMVVLLGPILDLDADARAGLRVGAAIILAFTAGCAWYVRRATPQDTVSEG